MKDVPTGLSPSAMAAHSPSGRRKSRKITEISREKMSDVNEALLDTQTNEYYTWGESTWDLVIFIGTGALGPAGSFQTCLLAVVNVLMQVVFVAIAYFNFTQPDVDETSVEDARRWRHASGHSLWSYSEVSRESMAERVCKLDKSLEQSGIQAWPNEPTTKMILFPTSGFFDKSFLPLQVVPGRAGGGSFRRKKNYIAKKEFAYKMCARRPTSAMPKPFLCCERAFCCSTVVM